MGPKLPLPGWEWFSFAFRPGAPPTAGWMLLLTLMTMIRIIVLIASMIASVLYMFSIQGTGPCCCLAYTLLLAANVPSSTYMHYPCQLIPVSDLPCCRVTTTHLVLLPQLLYSAHNVSLCTNLVVSIPMSAIGGSLLPTLHKSTLIHCHSWQLLRSYPLVLPFRISNLAVITTLA